MIVSKMHWLFKERFNRNSSNFYPDYSPMQIDQFLNDGVETLLQKHSDREDKQLFFDMMNPLLVSETLTGTDGFFDLKQLVQPYFYAKRITANLSCDSTTIPVKAIVEGQGRLGDLLTDAFQRPSNKWRRVIAVFENGGIRIYSEGVVNTITLHYYKYPKPIFYGGYDTLEYIQCQTAKGSNCGQFLSKASPAQDCELHEAYHARVVDAAVIEAQRVLSREDISLGINKLDSVIN